MNAVFIIFELSSGPRFDLFPQNCRKKRIIRELEENHKSQNMSINGGLFCPHMHVPQYKHSLTLMHGDNPTHGNTTVEEVGQCRSIANPSWEADPMLVYCWASVADARPTVIQYWINVTYLFGLWIPCATDFATWHIISDYRKTNSDESLACHKLSVAENNESLFSWSTR